jgi:hypothetical protein
MATDYVNTDAPTVQDLQDSIDIISGKMDELQKKPLPKSPPVQLRDIPQGPGSTMDSDTVDGIQTSTAANPTPNTLVPLDENGKLPTSVLTNVPGWQVVQKQDISAASTVSFTGLLPDIQYRLVFIVRRITDTIILRLTVNGSSAGAYFYELRDYNSNNAANTANNNGTSTFAPLNITGLGNTDNANFDIAVYSMPAGNYIQGWIKGGHWGGAATAHYTVDGAFGFSSSNSLSAIAITASAGTFTGEFVLLKLVGS